MIKLSPSCLTSPEYVSSSFDATSIERSISHCDYKLIANDSNLFWNLFCLHYVNINKTYHPSSCRLNRSCFDVIRNKNIVTIDGDDRIVNLVKKTIEEVRPFFVQALKKKQLTSFVMVANHFYQDTYKLHLIENSEVIDVFQLQGGICTAWYYSYISPPLPELSKSLGLSISLSKKQQSLRSLDDHLAPKIDIQEVDLIKLQPNKETCWVFPIPPKNLQSDVGMEHAYPYFKEQHHLCDFALVSQGGEIVKLHTMMLYIRGGTYFQTIIDGKWEESEKKSLSLSFSISTLRAFADFIYLGAETLMEKILADGKGINILELFEFANKYQIQSLINCSTNLISVLLSEEDKTQLEQIRKLAIDFNNEHLKELCSHFGISETSEQSKT